MKALDSSQHIHCFAIEQLQIIQVSPYVELLAKVTVDSEIATLINLLVYKKQQPI